MKQSKGFTSSISWSFSTKINFGGGVVIVIFVVTVDDNRDNAVGLGTNKNNSLRRKWLNGNNERETQNVYLLISV
jgi:hypothetical protein